MSELSMLTNEIKIAHMQQLSKYRESIIGMPPLKNLFLELTQRCNEKCIHCGSSCGENETAELSLEQYKVILEKIKSSFNIKQIMLDITGGEPLMRKDFFDIMEYANKLGYIWGMTSNGTLINDEVAEKLHMCGMRTIAISLDGLPETHNAFRQRQGAYDATINGIKALVKNGNFEHIQITTVVNHTNINELDALWEIVKNLGVDSWRIVNVEPMGRAKLHPEIALTSEEIKCMFDFIKNKRKQGYAVTYGCSHYLGTNYEREVRKWYFLCNAGLYTASITATGDICACLDIERRPELTQGNILVDDFADVWKNKFKVFRRDLSKLNSKCQQCDSCDFCHGGAFHSWDFEKNEQQVCFKDILF